MPVAGTNPEARARAHYKWAQRYAEKGGRIDQAIAHFGRALEYTRFGAHDIRLKPYDEMMETYEEFEVMSATNGIAIFPNPSRENDRAFYENMRAEQGSTLIAGPLRTHVAPNLEVDVDVGVRTGEQEYEIPRNGTMVPVNILGMLLWKLHYRLKQPYEGRSPRDIREGRYTDDALLKCEIALGDPLKVSIRDKNTPELEAKEKAHLYYMLRTRYRELRIKPPPYKLRIEDGYKYVLIEFFDEGKSLIKTQIVSDITLQASDDVFYDLTFCTNGFIYWYQDEE